LQWPGLLAGMDGPTRAFTLALIVSILLHGVILSIKFRLPEMLLNKVRDSQLEIILVNAKSASKPATPQARAQANLDGGGNTDEDRRAKTPLPPSHTRDDGSDLMQASQRVQQLEAQQRKLMTQARSQVATPARPKEKIEQSEQAAPVTGEDLARNAIAMARMEAQISKDVQEYNKRPRKKFVGARTAEAVEAQYVEDWRQKVERVGNYNYPQAARGRFYGNLVLTVSIRADGEVEAIEVSRSSGHRVLDDGARRIVELAAPYGLFPPKLRKDVDILVITRTWTFTKGDQLHSE
jgi:protein TonB